MARVRAPDDRTAAMGGVRERTMANDVTALAMLDKDQISALREHADRIARSGLVPDHFAKNPAAIYTAISMARALGEVPETLMQEIFFIGGRAGLSAKYMLSRLQRTHAIRGTVRYVVEGRGTPNLSVRAVAIDGETGETIEGPEVSLAMAKAEGWTKNSKYTSMPEVMLRKRAVTFLARDHYPGALMGFLVVDEAEDVAYAQGRIQATTPQVATGGFLAAATSSEVVDTETGEVLSGEPTEAERAELERLDREGAQ